MRSLLVLFSCAILAVSCSNEPERETLVVYSPHGKELLTAVARGFEEAHKTVDVRWLDMGSQDILDRLRSEKANPQADIWFGAPSSMFSLAEKEGLLEPYRPTWAAAVEPEAQGKNDGWYGTYQTPEVIAYNSMAVKPEDVPKDWDDVLDPKWRDKIVIRDPIASGTMRAIFGAMIMRNMQAGRVEEAGYEWLRKLSLNTKDYVINTTLLFQKLGRQEAVLTLWNMPDIELQKTQYKYPFAYVVPKSGTPVLTEGIAIVKGTTHLETAKSFYEFVTSPKSLAFAAKEFYRIPTRKDLDKSELPEWMRNLNIPKMEMDWELFEAKSKFWMEHWDSQIRGKK